MGTVSVAWISVAVGRDILSHLIATGTVTSCASAALNALCLLVVVEVSRSSSNLFNTLMVNIVDTNDVVGQMMVIVVVVIDNSDQVVVVSVHIVVDVSVVLVMNGVLLDDSLGQVIVELNSLVDWWLVGDQIARLSFTHRSWLEAAHVWRWKLNT